MSKTFRNLINIIDIIIIIGYFMTRLLNLVKREDMFVEKTSKSEQINKRTYNTSFPKLLYYSLGVVRSRFVLCAIR